MKNKPFIIHTSPTSQRDANVREQRRLKAARFFEHGVRQAEIARRLKVSRPAVHYWYSTWRQDGKEALRSRRHGPQSRMNPEHLAIVAQTLLRGAPASGYPTALWTLQRVREVIRKTTRVSFGQTHTWRILRAMGWSNQKPETRYLNRNEAAIKQWKEEKWPAIQKRGRVSRRE